jgi:release factor glutamine methyltransferase
MDVRATLRVAAAVIGGDSARADAELLLAEAMGVSRGWLLAHGDADVPGEPGARFAALAARRREGVPVALLLGRQAFWTLELQVDANTLVPRPDTERLVELALERLEAGRDAEVLDLGTGSGAIALAVASERPRARVTAVDASAAALVVARANAARLGLSVRMLHGDWFAPVAGERFDLVLANPPYVAEGDAHLPALRHEPRSALVAGPEGLDDLARIAAAAPAHLRDGGWLLFEHGATQGAAARALLARAGFEEVATWQDLGGNDRVSGGAWRAPGASSTASDHRDG